MVLSGDPLKPFGKEQKDGQNHACYIAPQRNVNVGKSYSVVIT